MIKSFIAFVYRTLNDKSLWLSFIAGLSLVFAYAPFSLWWLVYIVLPLWFLHLQQLQNKYLLLSSQLTATEEVELVNNNAKKQRRLVTKHSFIFAFGWFASGISWVHVSIDQFGGLPLVISLLLMILLCSYLALFTILACYLSCFFSKKGLINLWALPCLWMFGEYLRANILTGFPWLSLGYSQIDGPLAALAPIIGEIGISLVVLIICVGLSKILINRQRIFALSSVISLTLAIVVANQASWVTLKNDDVNVALIQGNIEQDIKWQPEQEWPTMLKYLQLSRENFDSDLIIWPESAIPALELLVSSQEFLQLVNQASLANDSAIITGIQNYHVDNKEYYNGLVVLGDTEKPSENKPVNSYFYNSNNRYYKHHLLPIGEFVPFGDFLRPLAPLFNLSMSSFSRGDYIQPNLRANGLNVLPLICFEIAFADQLAANFSNQTNLLLTVSNDAWFGDSHGPHQHMEIARMRALEFGRPLLRATNNGVTAVTDHLGTIQLAAPQFEQHVLKTKVQLVSGLTPYYLYGELLRWLLPLLSLLLPFISYRLRDFKDSLSSD
jgi:apolipoprotein N-acyltransferase